MTQREMTREALLGEVREFLSSERGIDAELVTESSLIRDELGLDSLDIAEIGMRWAESYSIDLDDAQIFTVETISDAIDFVFASASTTGRSPE